MTPVYTAEVVAAVDAAGTLKTFRFGTTGYNTRPGDVPSSVHFMPRIQQPCLMRRDMFSSGRTSGESQVGYGELVLVNSDGGLDALMRYSFGGRPLTLRLGDSTQPFSAHQVVLAGTMEQPQDGTKTISLRVKDKLLTLDAPLASATYGGTNVPPAGIDGTAADIKGKAKPVLLGTVYNVEPTCVNASKLIFQVASAAAAISNVYDRGVALTLDPAVYVSQADMEGTAPAAGKYRVWSAAGGTFFRLGSALAGQVTVDASAGATAANRTVAQLLQAIALAMGTTAPEISAADVAALDLANPAEVGIYVTDSSATALDAMDQLAASIGAWFCFDSLGLLRMGRLAAPAGAPVATLTATNIIGGLERATSQDDTNGLPVWRVKVNWQRNYTVSTDVAGSVSPERKAFLSEEVRTSTSDDATVKTQWLNAAEIEVDTLLVHQADADAEAARLLALNKTLRDTFNVTVRASAARLTAIDIGRVVQVVHRRYGMAAGRLFVVTGVEPDLRRNRLTLTLWG